MIVPAMPMLSTAFLRWRERRRRKTAIRELRAVDDRTLRDMGLTRGEIIAAVDGQVYRGAPAPPGRSQAAPSTR
jgi:uncharacterized protein YjiS (DUF1127 family)